MHKALVVGGVESVIRKSVAPFLAEYGVEVAHVWAIDGGKNILRPELPASIDTCILLTDMAPRDTMVPTLKSMCSKRRVVMVSSPHKRAQMDRALALAGYYRKQPQQPEMVELTLDAANEQEALPPAPVREPAPAPAPAQETKEEPVAKPAVTVVPPEKATAWSFDDLMGHLKATLKLLRDQHGVDEVLYSRSSGLEVTRRQTINDSVD